MPSILGDCADIKAPYLKEYILTPISSLWCSCPISVCGVLVPSVSQCSCPISPCGVLTPSVPVVILPHQSLQCSDPVSPCGGLFLSVPTLLFSHRSLKRSEPTSPCSVLCSQFPTVRFTPLKPLFGACVFRGSRQSDDVSYNSLASRHRPRISKERSTWC